MKKILLYLLALVFTASAVTVFAETTVGEGANETTVDAVSSEVASEEGETPQAESVLSDTEEASVVAKEKTSEEPMDNTPIPVTISNDTEGILPSTASKTNDNQKSFQKQVAEKETLMQQKKEAVQNKIEITKEELEQRRAEFQKRITVKRKAIIAAYEKKMVIRLYSALNRLEKLAGRIGSRIEKINETNTTIYTGEALNLVAEAEIKIVSLRTEVDSIHNELESMYDSDDPKTIFEEVKTKLRKIVDGIKETHQILVDAIGSLKAGVAEEEVNSEDEEIDDSDESDDSSDETNE